MNKKALIGIVAVIILFLGGWTLINKWQVKIAFINFTDSRMAEIHHSKPGFWNKILYLNKESDFDGVADCDVIYTFHLGKLTENQLSQLMKAKEKGAGIYMFSSTSSDHNLNTLSAEQAEQVTNYFNNGGVENFRRMIVYSRKEIAKVDFFSEEVADAIEYPENTFYRIGTNDFFEEATAYWEYYKAKGWHKKDAKTVAIVNVNTSPQDLYRSYQDSLITKIERKGYNVVAISGFSKKLEMLQAITPDLVVFFAHGRLQSGNGDQAVTWLRERNIPILNPQLINEKVEDWEKDQQGMSGGMMGQNLVVPELDGAIYPYAVAAQYKNKDGFYTFKAIPGKIETFTEVIDGWLRLKDKANKDKKVAIYFYKGAGQNAMVAELMEVGSSLLHTLNYLRNQGYNTGNRHPKTEQELLDRINKEAPVYGEYAQGSFEEYVANGNPAMVYKDDYLKWIDEALTNKAKQELKEQYGSAPGDYFSYTKNDSAYIAVPRLQFGNVVLLPVLPSALGESEYKMIHGVDRAPPHAYVASYLWSRKAFNADVICHWGTHGNLEFTPSKQVALSKDDWPEALIAPTPHIYVYSINNIGEAMMAKRRTYGTIVSHLTSPLDEAPLYGNLKELEDAISNLQETSDPQFAEQYKSKIRILLDSTGVAKDLELDSNQVANLDEETTNAIDHYLFHLICQKVDMGLHTFGKPFTGDEIVKTTRMMAVDPLISSLEEVDKIYKRAPLDQMAYRKKALNIIDEVLAGKDALSFINKEEVADLERLSSKKHPEKEELVYDVKTHKMVPKSQLSKITEASKSSTKKEGEEEMVYDVKTHKMVPKSQLGKQTTAKKAVLTENEEQILKTLRTFKENLQAIKTYYADLQASFDAELEGFDNGISGGYIAPSPGGDPAVNPKAVPTGKNLYSINAEETPTKEAWNVAKQLADNMLQTHIAKHGDYPKKIAFSLWSSEFIRNQGLDIAQVLYLLGVEPVWNASGRVYDVKLIPHAELGRPRIDVVVQTSGQFRDLAASRTTLINKAIELASNADDATEHPNFVKEGTLLAEKIMKEKGISPADARRFSVKRVFGALNGGYGTSIMGLVESGDKWESEEEIAAQYLNNMGALYDEEAWNEFQEGVFEAMLANTEVVMHPRSSSVTGPISLDHVYEFMGGLSLTVRNITGKDPDGYFNDYRNKYKPTTQGLKEAIWAETRTHLFNPAYIEAKMKEGPSAAENFAENFRDTYGWNVMKPDAIDKEIWEGYYDIYVKDKLNMGTVDFFKEKNPYALQEMTAVMLETIRKGYWKPEEAVTKEIVNLHAELVQDFNAGCSGFVCDNAKLKEMIENSLSGELKENYVQQIDKVRTGGAENSQEEGMVLEKEEITLDKIKEILKDNKNAVITLGLTILLIGIAVFWGIFKRRRENK